MADQIEAVGLELDAREFERQLRNALRRIDELESHFDRSVRAAGRQQAAFDGLGRKVLQLAAAYGAFRAAEGAAQFIFDSNVEFQRLEATLATVTGSTERAAQSFNLITGFASSTPYDVAQITDAFIQFRAFGVEPTTESLRGLGNFASAFSKDFATVSNAIVAAVNTSTEPIRAFGVQVRTQGEQLRVSFQGVERTIPRTIGALHDFMVEVGNAKFGDAMSRQMETLNGAISNLKDSSALLAKDIGEQGLNREINELVRLLDDAIQNGDEFARVVGGLMASGVNVGTEALEAMIEHLELITVLLGALSGAAIGRGVVGLAMKLKDLALVAGGLRVALAGLAGGPWGIALTALGGAIGVVAVKAATSADEVSRLADEIERLHGVDLGADMQGQTLEQLTAREQQLLDAIDKAEARRVEYARRRDSAGGQEGSAIGGRQHELMVDEMEKVGLLRAELDEVRSSHAALVEQMSKDTWGDQPTGVLGPVERDRDQVERIREANEALNSVLEKQVEFLAAARDAQIERLNLTNELAAKSAEFMAAQQAFEEQMAADREGKGKGAIEEEAQRVAEEAERMGRVIDQVSAQASDNFGELIRETEEFADAVEAMVEEVMAQLARLAIAEGISFILGSIFGGPVGGKLAATGGGPLGVPIPGKALGGAVMPSQPYMVGERGPEMIIPSSAGRVVPNHQLQTGGQRTHVTIELSRIADNDFWTGREVKDGFVRTLRELAGDGYTIEVR